MTILTRTVVNLIERILTDENYKSVKKDGHPIKGLKLFGFGRDHDNSEEQRTITTALIKKIIEFKPLKTDKESITALKDLIIEKNSEVEKLRSAKGWDEGGLNKTLTAINSHLDKLMHLLEVLAVAKKNPFNFIDQPDEAEPYSILCTHALYYLLEHIMCPTEENVFVIISGAVSKSITGITAVKIREKKENSLIENLIQCKKAVNGLDKKGTDYQELRFTTVKRQIEDLHRTNESICKESQLIKKLPIKASVVLFSVDAPPIKPSRGRLKESLDNAMLEMSQRCPAAAAFVQNAEGEANIIKHTSRFSKFSAFSHTKAELAKATPSHHAQTDDDAAADDTPLDTNAASSSAPISEVDDTQEVAATPPRSPKISRKGRLFVPPPAPEAEEVDEAVEQDELKHSGELACSS